MAKLTPLVLAGIMAGASAASVQTTPSFPNNGVSPVPTPAPVASDSLQHAAGLHELRRRAGTSVAPLTLLAAPDNTCGWVSGSIAVPYTCASGYSCGLVLAQSTASGGVMCYNADSYNFRFACYDYNQYYSSTMCDHLCAENAFYLKW